MFANRNLRMVLGVVSITTALVVNVVLDGSSINDEGPEKSRGEEVISRASWRDFLVLFVVLVPFNEVSAL